MTGDGRCRYVLDAWTHEVGTTLEHPDDELNLASRFVCVLTARKHVETGPTAGVVTKDDFFTRHGLRHIHEDGHGGE